MWFRALLCRILYDCRLLFMSAYVSQGFCDFLRCPIFDRIPYDHYDVVHMLIMRCDVPEHFLYYDFLRFRWVSCVLLQLPSFVRNV